MKYSGSALYWILVTSFSLTRLIYIIKLLWRNYLIQFKVIHTFDFQWNWLKILWTDGCLLTTGMSLPAWTCYYNYYTKLLYIYQSFLKIIIYIFFFVWWDWLKNMMKDMEHKPNLCTDTLDHFSSTLMDALFLETSLISAMWEDEKEFFKRKEPNQLFTTIHEYYTKFFTLFKAFPPHSPWALSRGNAFECSFMRPQIKIIIRIISNYCNE
jgi:hypothetical protein